MVRTVHRDGYRRSYGIPSLVALCVLRSASPLSAKEIKQVLSFPEFPSASVCRTCHVAIYDQWRASQHFRAWTSPLFRRMTNEYAVPGCLGCHAPDRRVTDSTPPVRQTLLFEGVTCASCHWDPSGVIHGPRGGPAPHPTARDTTLARADACRTCHLFGETYTQWQHGFLGQSGISCQQCHQTTTEALVADGAAARAYNLGERQVAGHVWPGASDSLFRASSISVTVEPVEGGGERGEVRITLQNIGAGHAVPTGWVRRTVELRLVLRAASGDSLARLRHVITTADTSHLMPYQPTVITRSFGVPLPENGEVSGVLLHRADPTEPYALMLRETWSLRKAEDIEIEGW